MNNFYKKGNKYKNVKTKDGFDSGKERKRFLELELLQKAGIITSLNKQVSFELIAKFTDKRGIKEREAKYIADFVYYDREKKSFVIEDVKSPITRKLSVYVLKRKLVKQRYPDYLFFEV